MLHLVCMCDIQQREQIHSLLGTCITCRPSVQNMIQGQPKIYKKAQKKKIKSKKIDFYTTHVLISKKIITYKCLVI